MTNACDIREYIINKYLPFFVSVTNNLKCTPCVVVNKTYNDYIKNYIYIKLILKICLIQFNFKRNVNFYHHNL